MMRRGGGDIIIIILLIARIHANYHPNYGICYTIIVLITSSTAVGTLGPDWDKRDNGKSCLSAAWLPTGPRFSSDFIGVDKYPLPVSGEREEGCDSNIITDIFISFNWVVIECGAAEQLLWPIRLDSPVCHLLSCSGWCPGQEWQWQDH